MPPEVNPEFIKKLSVGPTTAEQGTKVVIFGARVPFMCPQGAHLKPKSTKSDPVADKAKQTRRPTSQQKTEPADCDEARWQDAKLLDLHMAYRALKGPVGPMGPTGSWALWDQLGFL